MRNKWAGSEGSKNQRDGGANTAPSQQPRLTHLVAARAPMYSGPGSQEVPAGARGSKTKSGSASKMVAKL